MEAGARLLHASTGSTLQCASLPAKAGAPSGVYWERTL